MTPIGPVVEHALNWLREEGVDPSYSCLLLPTAPLVSAEILKDSFRMLENDPDKRSCFGVAPFTFPIQRAIRITDTNGCAMFQPEHYQTRSQDLEPAYHDAGQFSWCALNRDLPDLPGWNEYTLPYVLKSYEVQDIDTPEDWIRAEALYRVLQEIREDAS